MRPRFEWQKINGFHWGYIYIYIYLIYNPYKWSDMGAPTYNWWLWGPLCIMFNVVTAEFWKQQIETIGTATLPGL